MSRRLAPLAAVLAAALCCASVGSSAEPTPRGWARAANGVCLAYTRRAKTLGTPPSNDFDAYASWLRRALPLIGREIDDLAALPRPRATATRIARWIAVLRSSEKLTRRILPAVEAHDLSLLAPIGRRSLALYRTSGQMARSLGVLRCASSSHL